MTSYVLRLYDDPLLQFDASYGEGLLAGKIEAHVRWFDELKRALLPFPLAPECEADDVAGAAHDSEES